MAKGHKDLEFQLEDAGGNRRTFKNFDQAAGLAIAVAASTGNPVHLDVLTWSKGAARTWAGDAGVEVYESDPDASVHERLIIAVSTQGHVR